MSDICRHCGDKVEWVESYADWRHEDSVGQFCRWENVEFEWSEIEIPLAEPAEGKLRILDERHM